MFNPSTSKTILCIDDDDDELDYQRVLLERRGYAVLTARCASQGIQMAAASVLAAVIVDYHMPGMNGQEVAAEIKRITPQVPIVMVSSDEKIREQPLQVVDAFLPKDEAPERLWPVIARICGDSPPARPRSEQL